MKRTILLMGACIFGICFAQTSTTVQTENTNTETKITTVSATEIPADFPKYVTTGDVTQDAINYENAKKEWILKNPEKYSKMGGNNLLTTPDRVLIPTQNDFPVFINTGNPENDSTAYAYEKYIWISKNREAYDDLVRNGEINMGELEENDKIIGRIELGSNKGFQKQKFSKDEFNNLPLEKQKLYLAEPDKYEIVD